MAVKQLATQAKVYTKIEDELDIPANLDLPSGAATVANFKLLANMSTSGMALLEIDGVEYNIPLLLS